MPTRKPRCAVPTVEQPAITPGTSVTLNLTQALLVVAAILGFGSAFGTMIWTQRSTQFDVAEIKASQITLTKTTESAIKEQEEKRIKALADQDERRQKMADAFLASNRAIADKVGELNTLLAVAQANQKATYEKLSEQLNAVAPPAKRR